MQFSEKLTIKELNYHIPIIVQETRIYLENLRNRRIFCLNPVLSKLPGVIQICYNSHSIFNWRIFALHERYLRKIYNISMIIWYKHNDIRVIQGQFFNTNTFLDIADLSKLSPWSFRGILWADFSKDLFPAAVLYFFFPGSKVFLIVSSRNSMKPFLLSKDW